MTTKIFYIVLLSSSICFSTQGQHKKTFTNPLLSSGADPWCIYKDGYYYYTNTTGYNITIWKTKNIALLKTAVKKVVFTPPATGGYSKEIWAPEIHFFYGRWYIYFAADSGDNRSHRLWVLENSSPDPMKGSWKMKGRLTTPDNKWSIDGSVYEHKNKLFLVWSGWEGDVNAMQSIYIAAMSNPWTVKGKRVRISAPVLDWEKHGDLNNPNDVPHVDVNEGPQLLSKNDKLFLIYSASGCWTDYYALGMLTASASANLLDSSSWTKSLQPVFKKSIANGVYAPGHNSFFTSPDKKEDWILYHANDKPGQGCGNWRSPRAQRFVWNPEGSPFFGEPLPTKTNINIPSEEK